MPEQINARCSIYSDSIPLRIIRGTGFNFRRTNFELRIARVSFPGKGKEIYKKSNRSIEQCHRGGLNTKQQGLSDKLNCLC